jgi:hypothetical protein
MRRREFITLLGGTAASPLIARAQQRERMRRICVLMSRSESDPQGLEDITAFAQGLAELGWTALVPGRDQALDPAAADRIDGRHEHNRHGAAHLLKCAANGWSYSRRSRPVRSE